jgi:hypothetical protein
MYASGALLENFKCTREFTIMNFLKVFSASYALFKKIVFIYYKDGLQCSGWKNPQNGIYFDGSTL